MAGRTSRFLSELEASFDAAVAREEEQAAVDLARSFRNDERLYDVLARGGSSDLQTHAGARVPLVEVGRDYAIAGRDPEVLVQLERAAFHPDGTGSRPRRTGLTWLAVVRGWAAQARKVQVSVREGTIEGTLSAAARDFLTIEGPGRRTLVPHASIHYIKSCPED